MTLKTNWVTDPEVRNTLSYLDIVVLILMFSYNMFLVSYAIYLDVSVTLKYITNKLSYTCCYRNLRRIKSFTYKLSVKVKQKLK